MGGCGTGFCEREGGVRLESVGHPQRLDGRAQPGGLVVAGADGLQSDARIF